MKVVISALIEDFHLRITSIYTLIKVESRCGISVKDDVISNVTFGDFKTSRYETIDVNLNKAEELEVSLV